MKVVSILQPSYLPWIGYFDMIAKSDVFVYYDDVQFDKHGWRNRNRIKSAKGDYQWVTVPVLLKGLNKPLIHEVKISNETPWARKQISTLRQTYARAPYAKIYLDELEALLVQPWDLLMDLNLKLVDWLCEKFQIRTEKVLSSNLGITGDQTGRLVNICEHFKATHYLSGNAAKEYLDEFSFEKRSMKVVWADYQHPIYEQIHGPFLPYLSALDLLVHVGSDSRKFFGPLKGN